MAGPRWSATSRFRPASGYSMQPSASLKVKVLEALRRDGDVSVNPSPEVPNRRPVTDEVMVYWSAPSDRKSTRLNSSHVRISYAGFCLKNKKHLGELHTP